MSYAPFLYSLFFSSTNLHTNQHSPLIHSQLSYHHCLPVYNTSLSLLQVCIFVFLFVFIVFFLVFYSKSPDPFLNL